VNAEPENDAITRQQFYELRGEAVPNGSVGTAAEPAPADERACARCGKSLADRGPLTKWCSSSCRNKARREERAEATEGSTDPYRRARVELDAPDDPSPHTDRFGDDHDLAAVVGVLLDAGATITITVGGLEVCSTR
jgi:hypothetical protein